MSHLIESKLYPQTVLIKNLEIRGTKKEEKGHMRTTWDHQQKEDNTRSFPFPNGCQGGRKTIYYLNIHHPNQLRVGAWDARHLSCPEDGMPPCPFAIESEKARPASSSYHWTRDLQKIGWHVVMETKRQIKR